MDDRPINDSIIKLACYEPAGSAVEFSTADLLGHTLAFGATGTGKTTRIVYPMIEQLVRHDSINSDEKVSLVIYDTKGDGEVREFVKEACRRANRLDDLTVIDGSGEFFLDLFQALPSQELDGVESICSILASMIPRDGRNTYWERTWEALLRQALRLWFLTSEKYLVSEMVEFLVLYLLRQNAKYEEIQRRLIMIEEQLEDALPSKRAVLDEIRAMHDMWESLDHRTRSILRSMSASVIGPLNSPVAQSYLVGKSACDVGKSISAGKVLVVSIDGILGGEVSRLLGTMLKGRFYESVLGRHQAAEKTHRLAGLVLDDWTLCASGGTGTTYSDVDALALIRSRGGFFLAAAQGISGLDLVLGTTSRKAALANFNNVFFFRSRDSDLDAMAASWLGEAKDTVTDRSYSYPRRGDERSWTEVRYEREMRRPAVPLGSLARLLTGEAVAMIGGQVFSQPLCLVPSFGKDTPF